MEYEKRNKPAAVVVSGLQDTRGTRQDDAAMAEVGKVQQFKRNFGFWTLLGFTASMMCSWEAVFFANLTGMINGGPPTIIYGFIYAWLGALATAASLAEMASIYPTSAGQYHWTAMLAPAKQRVFVSWFCGWIATLGWIANTAAGAFFAATMIQGVVYQRDNSYDPLGYQGSLILIGVMCVVLLVNVIGTRLFSAIEGGILVLHLAGFLAILVPLLYYSEKGTSTQVWATFDAVAGWDNKGVAWFVGLISANLPLIGYDGPAHLAEEVRNANRVVPWAMVGTVIINGALGLAVSIGFSYCILPHFDEYINSATGYDYIPVFFKAVGEAGGTAMTAVLILMVWLATFGFLATASRQTWAFARDRGLPFSHFLAHVNKTIRLPIRAIVLCAIIPCLLGLINAGSTTAFNAIVSLTEAGLFTSYLVPICLLMTKRLRGDHVQWGPFKMGAIGPFVNAFSAVFLIISVFFSFFPPELPVTLTNMNWSIVVFGGFIILGLIWYVIVGRRQYNGPIVERAASAQPLDSSDEV